LLQCSGVERPFETHGSGHVKQAATGLQVFEKPKTLLCKRQIQPS
jgi:hypothetical protein